MKNRKEISIYGSKMAQIKSTYSACLRDLLRIKRILTQENKLQLLCQNPIFKFYISPELISLISSSKSKIFRKPRDEISI